MRLVATLLATAFALPAALGQAQLLPAGEFAARDGRPGPGKAWKRDDTQGRALAASINATAAQTPVVIDYEHQTLRAEANGQPAPAAGWIRQVTWRDGQGLFAQVEWTDAAKARIQAGEYRYISPVITADAETGAVTGMHLAALVNHPALLGMEPVMAQLNAQLTSQTNFPTRKTPNPETHPMNLLTQLVALLGLAAGADDATTVAAVTALKTKAEAPPKAALPAALSSALGLQAGADEATALSAVAALKGSETTTMQTITALQGQVTALTTQINEGTVVGLVDAAIAAHKLLPVQRDWALNTGRKDVAALQAFIAATPPIPGLAGQSGGQGAGEQRDALATNLKPAELAAKAVAWQTKQAAAGVQLSTAQAVNQVIAGAA